MEFSRRDIEEGGDEEGGVEESLLASGVIHSVVRKKDHVGGAQHFKLVNASGACNFVPCKILMSTAKSNVYKVCNWIIYGLLFWQLLIIIIFMFVYYSDSSASKGTR